MAVSCFSTLIGGFAIFLLSIADEMDAEFMRDDEPHDMIGGYTIESKKFH